MTPCCNRGKATRRSRGHLGSRGVAWGVRTPPLVRAHVHLVRLTTAPSIMDQANPEVQMSADWASGVDRSGVVVTSGFDRPTEITVIRGDCWHFDHSDTYNKSGRAIDPLNKGHPPLPPTSYCHWSTGHQAARKDPAKPAPPWLLYSPRHGSCPLVIFP